MTTFFDAQAPRSGRALLKAGAALALGVALASCSTNGGDSRGESPLPVKLVREMSAKGMKPSDPIMIRVYKQESELEVWKRDGSNRYALMKTYPICRWSGKLGPKTRENDRQAPEGFYQVSANQMNPRSRFHLSFDLGYPNNLEKALGYNGSALMIHGACSSAGCFAMSDAGAAEIYATAREALRGGQASFQVQSLPFRMTAANLAANKSDPSMPLWRNLKQGADRFDATRQPPVVAACGRRYVFGSDPATAAAMTDPLAPCPAGVSGGEPIAVADAKPRAQIASAYVDGGMNVAFRRVLATKGPEALALTTSSKWPVSTPEAALADPYMHAALQAEIAAEAATAAAAEAAPAKPEMTGSVPQAQPR